MVTKKAIAVAVSVFAVTSGAALASAPTERSVEPPRIKHVEKEIAPGIWRVTTRSDSFGYAKNIAFYRAAQLLADRGFEYVQLIDQKGQVGWQTNRFEPGKMRGLGEFMQLTVRGAHNSVRPTDCRAKQEDHCFALPTASILARLAPTMPVGFSAGE
jgi:hypothetical protein